MVNGSMEYAIDVDSAAYVSLDPRDHGYTDKPRAAAISLHLHNVGDSSIVIVNVDHAAYPPAATYAGARACLCVVKELFPGADLEILAPIGGFPDIVDTRSYAAIAEGDNARLVVNPRN